MTTDALLDALASKSRMQGVDPRALFQHNYVINLASRTDRLKDTEHEFKKLDLPFHAFPAYEADDPEMKANSLQLGHGTPAQAACQKSHLSIVEHANNNHFECVGIFEDDVVFHPRFFEFIEKCPPPLDWDIIVFGGVIMGMYQIASPGWVTTSKFWALHSYVVRETAYHQIIQSLNGPFPGNTKGVDNLMGALPLKTYVSIPGMTWQRPSFSDLRKVVRKPFSEKGMPNVNGNRNSNAYLRMNEYNQNLP